jgi:RHS repeat-associated protein
MSNDLDGIIDYFMPEVVTAQDYYPFGMTMPGRNYNAGSGYRYGFNGKELDKEVASTTTYDYGFRIYSPALGKFLSVDPLFKSYPWYTPYQFAGNKPINSIDLDGLEELPSYDEYIKLGERYATAINKITDEKAREALKKAQSVALNYQTLFLSKERLLSAYNLFRYMEGKGGYDVFQYNAIIKSSNVWQFSSVNDRARANIENDMDRQSANLAKERGPGVYNITVQTTVDRAQTYFFASDLGTAFGSYEVLAEGNFTVTVDEKGKYKYEGTILYTFRDTYRWHSGKGGNDTEDGANHDDMNLLQQVGAKPFFIRAYYMQSLKKEEGDIFSEKGEISDSPSTSLHMDPLGNYYSMPKSASLNKDFRKNGK